MVNVFPILFLGLLAHFLLRVVVGFVYLYLGFVHLRKRGQLVSQFTFFVFPFPRMLVVLTALVECVVGVMFILGYYTQIAALASIVLSVVFMLLHRHFKGLHIPERLTYLLLFAASLSLLITGAGAFAFDLPI